MVKPHLIALQEAEEDSIQFDNIPLPRCRYVNILMSFRDQFWRHFRDGFFENGLPLAPDFACPWSSQAFCFNLFYPYIRNSYDDLALFQALAGCPVGGILSAGFNRRCNSQTSLRYDFLIEHADGSCLCFVVRYAEACIADGFMNAGDDLHQGLGDDPRHIIQFILPEANTALNADLDRIIDNSCTLQKRADRIHSDFVLAWLAKMHESAGDTRESDAIEVTHEDLMLDKYFPYLRSACRADAFRQGPAG